MASREQIYAVLNKQREIISRDEYSRFFKNWNKVIQYYFLSEQQIWHFRFVNGILEGPYEEEIKNPDIQFKLNGSVYCDMMTGKITGLKAFRQGKIKLKASPAELLKLARLDGIYI